MKKQKTVYTKKSDTDKQWYIINAKDQILGRLASYVARILLGKNKATYSPSVDMGDFVIILNADQIKVTGKKATDKIYYNHSRFPGGLKQRTFNEMIEKHPEKVLYTAIKGMLPKNRLGRQMLTKVKIYANDTHPHDAQSPIELLVNKEEK